MITHTVRTVGPAAGRSSNWPQSARTTSPGGLHSKAGRPRIRWPRSGRVGMVGQLLLSSRFTGTELRLPEYRCLFPSSVLLSVVAEPRTVQRFELSFRTSPGSICVPDSMITRPLPLPLSALLIKLFFFLTLFISKSGPGGRSHGNSGTIGSDLRGPK
eukprot:754217-Hanusia_phi.AAC.5